MSVIEVSRRGEVSVVLLNRPDRLNAFDGDMTTALMTAVSEADNDPDTKAIVITGAGRAFSAGGDVRSFGTNVDTRVNRRGWHLANLMLRVEKPTIAMVNGPAVGLGASIALFADMAIAAEDARIGDTHINVGLVPGDGGAVIWPLLIGPPRAKEMLMTGRLLSGIEAERLGLVNYAVPGDQLRARTLELATEIARQPTYAVRATKFAINRHIKAAMNNTMDVALALELISLASEEHREAAREFVRSRASRK